MTTTKNIISSMNESLNYKNFSEEVIIKSEVVQGAFSSYVIETKNGISFQNVSGMRGIKKRGFLGFINGDRGRPAVIGATADVNVTTSVSTPPWSDTNDIT